MRHRSLRFHGLTACFLMLAALGSPTPAAATDYFLTIGGGYNPQGNQASLEANVLFFEQLLKDEHRASRNSSVFFADGYDDKADLQVTAPEEDTLGPLTDFLQKLHYRRSTATVTYRNHQVPNIAGPISPKNIESNLRRSASTMKEGDRLIVYATAHGEPAKGKNKHDTFISCWNGQKISAKTFSSWLEAVPAEVPVIMVMAQCYCGGYAHTIFNDVDADEGLSDRLRCGFFAQQYDLPAAGCRPDIENDEEYSSFFWGAFAGRTRNGREMTGADANGDGKVSFAEAHAQAVIESMTIDIPLRTTEVLLRRYSRIAEYEHRGMPDANDSQSNASQNTTDPSSSEPKTAIVAAMSGSIASVIAPAEPELRRTAEELCKQLDLTVTQEVTELFEAFSVQSKKFSALRRSSPRGRRGRSSSRRQLREEIGEIWPELADRSAWRDSKLLVGEGQAEVLAEIEELRSFEAVQRYFADSEEYESKVEEAELRDVKFQRLINTLEVIVLAKNLPQIATAEVTERYQRMLRIEESFLSP